MPQQTAIETTVAGLGYELVEIEHAPGGLLRVTIDHPVVPRQAADLEPRFITVDDCEKVTRQLQHVLEVEGFAYERLEVSSPGLDRPLKSAADFARFVGEQVELTLKVPFRGRKRYRGELQASGEGWRVILADVARAAPGAAIPVRKTSPKAAPAKPEPRDDSEVEQALDFTLGEVREARLVPVIDFKGRRFAPEGSPGNGTRPHEEADGGRIQ
ncbi:MAG: ribosome maturation factor RimP [Caldimonas sp.]